MEGLFIKRTNESLSGKQCYERYSQYVDPKIKKGPWDQNEYELLRKAISKYGVLNRSFSNDSAL